MTVGQPFFIAVLTVQKKARNKAVGQERRNEVMEETKKQGHCQHKQIY